MSKVLVTGGAGFVGSETIEVLLRDPTIEVIVLDNFIRGSKENLIVALESGRVRLIEGDICDKGLVNELTTGVDFVIHLAALRITHCASDPNLGHDVMTTGTFNVIDAAIKNSVKRVIAASSASVYGQANSFPTHELHHPYHNRTLYGAGKSYLEGLLRSYNEMFGLNYIALRYFNVYGPRMDIHGKYTEVLIKWMKAIDSGIAPTIIGDPNTSMDFVHVHDVARANCIALKCELGDHVFNVASGRETTLNELAKLLLQVMGSRLEPILSNEKKVNAVARRLADVSLATSMLGFKSSINIKDGLKDLVAWFRRESS